MSKTSEKLPALLQAEVKNSGIQLNKAEQIAANYAPLMIQAQELGNQLKKLKIGKEEDVEPAKRIRLDLGKICSNVAKQKDNDKEIIKIESKFIMGLFHSVEGFARLTQKDAEEIEKHAERLEEARLEELKEARIKQVAAFGVDGELLNLHMMQDDIFDNYLNGVKLNHQAQKDAEEKAQKDAEELEIKRTKFMNRKAELLEFFGEFADLTNLSIDTDDSEFQIMKAGAKNRKEADEKARAEQAKENARLKKEADNAAQAAKELEERLKKQREEQEAKLQEQKEKNEALEAAEVKRQNAAKAEKENAAKVARDAAKAPDIEKIKLSIEQCVLNPLKLEDAVMQETFDVINKKFQGFKKWSDELIKGAE